MKKDELIQVMKENGVDTLSIDYKLFFHKENDLEPMYPEDAELLNKVLPHVLSYEIQDGVLKITRVTPYIVHFIGYYKYRFEFEVLDKNGPIGHLSYQLDADEVYRFEVREGMHLEEIIGVEAALEFMNGHDLDDECIKLVHTR